MKENMFNQFEFTEELKEKLVLFVVYQNKPSKDLAKLLRNTQPTKTSNVFLGKGNNSKGHYPNALCFDFRNYQLLKINFFMKARRNEIVSVIKKEKRVSSPLNQL